MTLPEQLPSSRRSFWTWIACFSLLLCGLAGAQKLRLVAANLSSGSNQSYDGGHGARILQGLDPDVVMIQEFNVGNNSTSELRSFVTTWFGSTFVYYHQGASYNIPNGIISRYPILSSGSWNDPELSDREFAWARIDIPGTKDLWAVSVHVKASDGSANETRRNNSAIALRDFINANVPAAAYLAIGGDFNAYSRTEPQFTTLSSVVRTVAPFPADKNGDQDTNAGRNEPYDAVLPDADLYALQVPVVIGSQTFADGLVADTRVYTPIADISPALSTDSGATAMQHMAIVRDFQLPSATPPTIATTSPLAGGTVGTAYSQTFTASSGTSPYTWSVSSGSLPGGLTLASTGVLSGTPTASGTFTFTVQVTDSASSTATKSISLTITPALAVSTTSLAGGTIGTAYSQTLAATGGTTPYTWNISTGTIPTGLTFSSAGVLSGTPTTSGAFTFTTRVVDNTAAAATRSFSVAITPTLTLSTASLAGGTVGTSYSQTLAATGGTTPYTWSIATGTIPTGLTFSSAGLLSGTPTASGTFTFTARVADNASAAATRSFSVVITPTLTLSTASLAGGTVGTTYSQTLAASGGTSPYTWNISTGTIPTGLTFNSAGLLSGTPTASGTFTFTARVADNASAAATRSFSVIITPTLVISTPSLAAGTVGSFYSATLVATGGTVPYAWDFSAGTLPDGLSLSGTGILSGIPEVAGTFDFTARVDDNASAAATKFFSVVITPTLVISTPSLAAGTVGSAYSESFAATGGTAPYSWSLVSGELPEGVMLNESGSLAGTASADGTFLFTARVADSAGASAEREYQIVITPALVISSPPVLPASTVGGSYSITLQANGGTAPYTWEMTSGELPPGLALGTDGTLDGTTSQAGEFTFTASVTDAAEASAARSFTLVVTPALSIGTTTLPPGITTAAYSQSLVATGGTAPYAWSLFSGTLPQGITLDGSGNLTGTPSQAGSFTFSIQVTDAVSGTASQSFTVTILAPLAIAPGLLPDGVIGTAYARTIDATGGTAPYAWSLLSGTLPDGLTFGSDGTLSGSPTTAGTYNFTLQATDAAEAVVSQEFSLRVIEPLTFYLESSGLPAGSAMLDPDNDGVSNLVEFLLGGNPLEPDTARLPSLTLTPDHASLTYHFTVPASTGSVAWKIQYGNDLGIWTDAVNGENGVTITILPEGDARLEVTAAIPVVGEIRLVRLAVTGP